MDPDTCLEGILDAWEAEDNEKALELAVALREWMAKGGFAPALPFRTLYRLVDVVACALEQAGEDRQ